MRAAIVRMLEMSTSPADLRVALVVLELTAGHGKLDDNVARSEIARRAGVSERTVTRSLAKLAGADVVDWHPARARGQLGTLRLSRVEMTSSHPPSLTRDQWMSRVQVPNTRQIDTRRETNSDPTRDSLDVPVPPSTSVLPPVDNQNPEEKTKKVLDHIAATAIAKAKEPIRDREAYVATVLSEVDVDRLLRIVDRHPDAPIEMLAGAAVGEPTPYLASYRRAS